MSTESISPISFYRIRNFGYRRFEGVLPNSLENRILLFDKYPIFDIKDDGLESFPMVIEVNTQYLPSNVINMSDDYYYADRTLYLNPFSTRFFFRTEEEKIGVISKSDASIETKMVDLYADNFKLYNPSIPSFQWNQTKYSDASSEFVEKYVKEDVLINKLKGFLYCYYISMKKNMTKDDVLLCKFTKQLNNVLSAVLTLSECYPTNAQREEIETLTKNINDLFSAKYRMKLDALIKEKSVQYKFPDLRSFIETEVGIDNWCELKKHEINEPVPFSVPIFDFFGARKSDDRNRFLDKYIKPITQNIEEKKNQKEKESDELEKMPKLSQYEICSIDGLNEFVVKVFNEYLKPKYSKNDFLRSRYEFAKTVGIFLRDFLSEKWDKSPQRIYVNSLLKNLNEFSEFSVNSSDSLFLRSFACFCQKGDSDVDKLEDYLIYNEIEDVRIALGLWGCVFGFSDIPKTMTNKFFNSNNINLVETVYKHIFRLIHGIDLNGFHIEQSTFIQRKETELKKNESKISELDCIFTSKSFSNMKDIAKQWYKTEILKLWKGVIDRSFVDGIKKLAERNDIPERTKTKPHDFVSLLTSYLKKEEDKEGLLFTDQEYPLNDFFYCDKKIWQYIVKFLPDKEKLRKALKDDLDWFQSNYKESYLDEKKGKTEGVYKDLPKDNASVIEHYKKYCCYKRDELEKNSPKMRYLAEFYIQADVSNLINQLKNYYQVS